MKNLERHRDWLAGYRSCEERASDGGRSTGQHVKPASDIRVVVVGTPAARARLREALADSGIDVAGEAATLAAAEELDGDAFVIASPATRAGEREGVALESLTPRETDVLELLAEGLPNKAIAARLDISDQTVKFHVSSICGKLGASNRTEAVRLGVRRGLITL